jgi:hypothetical protein
MIDCPKTKKQQCIIWEVSAITLLVFLAVYAIVAHAYDFSATKELFISIGGTVGILWAVWVVRTFRSIMSWWINMQDNVDHALALLNDAKKDLEEIRSNSRPK